MNGELSARWHVPLEAAGWSFGSGFLVLCVLLALLPRLRRGMGTLVVAFRSREIRWWQCVGGMLGALLVAVQTYAVPLVGVAVFTVAVVAGQTSSGLAVDRAGLSPSGRVPVNRLRLLAAGLAVVGALVASAARGGHSAVLWLPALLAVGVGATSAVQAAINGHVNLRTGFPLSTTWLNFGMGVIMLAAVTLVHALVTRGSAPWTLTAAPWWAWFGGVCGIGAVAVQAATVRRLGVLILAIATLTGQLGAALVLDIASPATRGDVGPQLVAGVLITFAGAAVAGLSRRIRRTEATLTAR
jgi:transporter family-2 protein